MVEQAAEPDPTRYQVTVVRCTISGWEQRQATLGPGATILDAIRAAGLITAEDGDGERLDVGIFNRVRRMDDPVSAGDRIEIYRPLLIDPKAARRLRARAAAKGRGG
jgi:putative ubiquitin-RnfH superfamily antitoxin RatB of RatAB toxin-antitoxin module